MRFKRLLEQEEKLKKIESLLQSDFQGSLYPTIYRGTSSSVDVFDIREIRKDRKPSGTRFEVQGLVDAYENSVYAKWPKRSGSKFGSPDRVSAGGYGPYEVVVFPEKSADVCWIEYDPTTEFFHDSYSALKTIIDSKLFGEFLDVLEMNSFEELSQFLYKAEKFYKEQISYKKYDKYLNSNIEELRSEYEDLKNEKTELQHQRGELLKVFRAIEMYFSTLKEGADKGAYEVIFDGEEYLRIDANLFEDNFSWSGRRWKITQNF